MRVEKKMRVEQEMKMKTKIIPSLTKRSSGIFPTDAVFARFCLLCGEKFERPRPGRCVVASVFFRLLFFFPLYALLRQAFSPSPPPLSSRLASTPGRRFPSRRSSRLTSPNTSTPRRRFPSLTQPTIVSTSVSSTRRGECSFEVYFFSNVPIQFHRLFRNAVSLGTKHVFPGEPSSWPRHNHARATPGEALANFTRLFSSAPHVAARGTARSALQATSRRRRRERDVSHARVAFVFLRDHRGVPGVDFVAVRKRVIVG